MDDFTKQAKTRYDELTKKIEAGQAEIEKLEAQRKPLKAYLMEAGVLEAPVKKPRGRKPKEAPAPPAE